MPARLACIVEGHGEVEAVPVLLRRIAAQVAPELALVIDPVLRIPRSKAVKPNEVERGVTLAAHKLQGAGAILILLDSDEDCPATLGPALLDRAQRTRSDLPIAVVLAKHEFEAWFLASAESLRGARGLSPDLAPPPDPESIRDAKGWLSQRLPVRDSYRETLHQASFADRLDLDLARARSGSFDKCYRDVQRLLRAMSEQ